MKRTIQLILAGTLLLSASWIAAQEWTVPEEQAAVTNPSEYTLENVEQGKVLYMVNCKSCHGDPGRNNPLALVPLPVDVASERMQANSEGAIFHKITAGRAVMPAFESTLSEEERWKLVNFIMNYSPDREQILVDLPPVKATLTAVVVQEKRTVAITAKRDEDGTALSGVPVMISTKKAFGNMEIGQAVTNENGEAEFEISENVMGDAEGNISVVVSLNEDYEALEAEAEQTLTGTPKETEGLIRPGVLWSTNKNIPRWLLLSFLAIAGGAWITIGYVVVQIVKVKKQSKL
ncbi:MAG: c-type cytochrome [Bacteroidota bacterium]